MKERRRGEADLKGDDMVDLYMLSELGSLQNILDMKVMSLVGVVLLLIAATQVQAAPTALVMSYCGFGEFFCGDSFNDDVYSRSNSVLLAYALIAGNGAIIVDADNYPKNLVTIWRNTGKKVVISIGGPKADWTHVYESQANRQNFLNTVANAVRTYGWDGVDLDIQGSFLPSPKQLSNLIIDLRKQLNMIGRKFLVLTADCISIYQGVNVPDADSGGQPFNYLVPVITLADSAIDYYQVKAYSNWYDGYDHTTLQYLQDVYLNWRNLQGFCPGCKPIAGFKGVAQNKLLMGVVGSPDARKPVEYAGPGIIKSFKNWLLSKGYDMVGFNVWNSHWDFLNGNQIASTIVN